MGLEQLTFAVVDMDDGIAILESFDHSTNQSLSSLRNSIDRDKSVRAFGTSVYHCGYI